MKTLAMTMIAVVLAALVGGWHWASAGQFNFSEQRQNNMLVELNSDVRDLSRNTQRSDAFQERWLIQLTHCVAEPEGQEADCLADVLARIP
jgi:hypothetical protein